MALHTLLVEDNKLIRDNLIPTLESLSAARVRGVAETEAAAMAMIEAHDGRWDVAVVDLFLRAGSGLSVVERCRSRGGHQFVVIFSNYATPEMRQQALQVGADAVFDKSTEIDGLLDFLERLSTARH
ncbi:response regulator [Variovorax sp. H27-G14]|uniref:response regulator n=1 Tax=Variovorax sp. H27-G14 TaxID=3111914 RepID=UPI0038FC6386